MARIITELPATARRVGGSAARKKGSIYPLEEWLDGQMRCLVQGEDFKCKVGSLVSQLSQSARDRGLKFRYRRDKDDLTLVYIRAIPNLLAESQTAPAVEAPAAEAVEVEAAPVEPDEVDDDGDGEDFEADQQQTQVA